MIIYFCVGISDKSTSSPPPDVQCFDAAQIAYSDHRLLGSPSKDVRGETRGRVIGAEINADPLPLRCGICTLGSPVQKRYSLAWITLQICCLPFTTHVLHLCLLGGWVACLTYRRLLMAVLNASFNLVDANIIDSNRPQLIRLPRAVAHGLTLLACLVCLAVTDICAAPCSDVFCIDASLQKGAICSAKVTGDFCKFLWRVTRSKWAFIGCSLLLKALLNVLEFMRKSQSLLLSLLWIGWGSLQDLPSISLFSRNSIWSLPPSCLGYRIWSAHPTCFVHGGTTMYDILNNEKRPLRSRDFPFGFDVSHGQTAKGNLVAHRALQFLNGGV